MNCSIWAFVLTVTVKQSAIEKSEAMKMLVQKKIRTQMKIKVITIVIVKIVIIVKEKEDIEVKAEIVANTNTICTRPQRGRICCIAPL